MPNLGSQFDNTYWENPNSGKVEHYKNPYSEREHAQGLLFHPGTGTQSYSDPMYSSEQRYGDIKKAVNPTIKGSLDERDAMGVMMDTKFTKSEFENKPPTRTVIGNTEGLRTAAHYNSNWNTMHISERSALDLSGNRTAFAHEWGHKVDSDVAYQRTGRREYPTEILASVLRTNKRSRIIASPISEGIADAFGERYGMKESDLDFENAGHEDQFNPLKNNFRGTELQDTGYRVNNPLWKDKQQQALYAATRIHVAMHGHAGIESLPNIEELAQTHLSDMHKSITQKENDKWSQAYDKGKDYSRKKPEETKEYSIAARHLYLGKLVHENPHVEKGLFQLGFGDLARNARAEYIIRAEGKSELDRSAKQPQLPGVDDEYEQLTLEDNTRRASKGPELSKKFIERQDLKELAEQKKARNASRKRRSSNPWNNLF